MTGRRHGTYARYVVDRCRCEPCRTARALYERDRVRRAEPAYVAGGPARAHVEELRSGGMGLKQIARLSGLAHGTLSKLIYGDSGRSMAPSKRVRRSTESALFDVASSAGSRRPAGPTWALVDEMVAAGAPKSRIAEQLGQVGQGLQLGRRFVSARNAEAVAELYRRWSAGEVLLVRRDSHGGRRVAPAPPPEAADRDVSHLMLDLAEIVEARNDDRGWAARAACRTPRTPPRMFFPGRGDAAGLEAALVVCRSCPVMMDCRAANIDRRDGVVGGLSSKARRELRSAPVNLQGRDAA